MSLQKASKLAIAILHEKKRRKLTLLILACHLDNQVLNACLGMVLTHTTFMIRTKLTKLHLSPISLHSASSVCIPSSVNSFWDMLPTIRLSLLGSTIIRKYTKPFNACKRRGMYSNVSKSNAKRCVCCTKLCTKTTITLSVNGRQFSIINNNDMD